MIYKGKFKDALQSDEWRIKRAIVIERDGGCKICKSSRKLHVHHLVYIKGLSPVEIPCEYLVTLCEYHHGQQHKFKPLRLFVFNSFDEITSWDLKLLNKKVKDRKIAKPKRIPKRKRKGFSNRMLLPKCQRKKQDALIDRYDRQRKVRAGMQ